MPPRPSENIVNMNDDRVLPSNLGRPFLFERQPGFRLQTSTISRIIADIASCCEDAQQL